MVIIQQDIKNSKANTHQSGRYSLDWFDHATGIAQVENLATGAVYWVDFYANTCTCKRFRFGKRGEKRCHHHDIRTAAGWQIWEQCVRRAGSQVKSSSLSASLQEFMDTDMTDSEAAVIHRWEWDVDPVGFRHDEQVIWGGCN